MEFTTNRNWPKPADGEDGWGDEMRAMVDDLDADTVPGTADRFQTWSISDPGVEVYGKLGTAADDYILRGGGPLVLPSLHYDPAGWVDPDPVAADPAWWGSTETMPAYSVFRLPRGVYLVGTVVRFNAAFTASGGLWFAGYPTEEPTDTLAAAPYYAIDNPYVSQVTDVSHLLEDSGRKFTSHLHTLSLYDDYLPIIFYYWTHPAIPPGDIPTIDYYFLGIQQIGKVRT